MQPLSPDDPRTIGPYQLLGRVGEGGMGVVYQARSRSNRLLAVKVVHEHLLRSDRGFRSRFRREIAAAKTVGGFWTAAVVDGDADAPTPWYASAFIDAPSMRDAVRGGGAMDLGRAADVGAQVAEALEAIHRAGLVHRDLKPSNVLLADDGVRVIDFGIARSGPVDGRTGTLTPDGAILGTPGYLAPEQIEDGAATPASDVFALGALLVYATTGNGPFPASSNLAVLARTLVGDPVLDDVPARLRPLVRRCLDRDPRRRPTLERLQDELGSLARGPSTPRLGPPPAPAPAPTVVGPPAAEAGVRGPGSDRTRRRPVTAAQRRSGKVGPRTTWRRPPAGRVALVALLIGVVAASWVWNLGGDPLSILLVGLLSTVVAAVPVERAVRRLHDEANRDTVGLPLLLLGWVGGSIWIVVALQPVDGAWWWSVVVAVVVAVGVAAAGIVLVIAGIVARQEVAFLSAACALVMATAGFGVYVSIAGSPLGTAVGVAVGGGVVLAVLVGRLLRVDVVPVADAPGSPGAPTT